jgi:hypothetical protein
LALSIDYGSQSLQTGRTESNSPEEKEFVIPKIVNLYHGPLVGKVH